MSMALLILRFSRYLILRKRSEIISLFEQHYFVTLLLNDFTTPTCDNTTIEETQIWEFLPKKGYLQDPIKIEIDITEQSDILKIQSLENREEAVYAITGSYPTDINENYDCSSENDNSYATFIKRENDVYLQPSLATLKQCGFSITDNGSYYVLAGYIIHTFPETNQIYYYEVSVSFSSTLNIEDTSIALDNDQSSDMQIVIIQQQTETSELSTHYIPAVTMYGSDSDSEFLESQIGGILTIQIDLPATVESLYTLTLPSNQANLYNDYGAAVWTLSFQEQVQGKNTYLIDVNLDGVDAGNYRLKFTCQLELNTRLRRLLNLNTVDLMIDKQINIEESKEENGETNEEKTEEVNITDIQQQKQLSDEENSSSESLLMIIIVIVSGLAIFGLLITAIIYARKKVRQRKQEEQSESSVQDPEIQENQEIQEMKKQMEEEIPDEFIQDNMLMTEKN